MKKKMEFHYPVNCSGIPFLRRVPRVAESFIRAPLVAIHKAASSCSSASQLQALHAVLRHAFTIHNLLIDFSFIGVFVSPVCAILVDNGLHVCTIFVCIPSQSQVHANVRNKHEFHHLLHELTHENACATYSTRQKQSRSLRKGRLFFSTLPPASINPASLGGGALSKPVVVAGGGGGAPGGAGGGGGGAAAAGVVSKKHDTSPSGASAQKKGHRHIQVDLNRSTRQSFWSQSNPFFMQIFHVHTPHA